MTLSRTTLSVSAPREAETAKPIPADADARRDWKYCLAAVAVLAVAYLLLQNGRWVFGPDSAYYIAVGRNLALGRGFVFNGSVVGRIPPLWPLTLALALKISNSFWFLNLIPMFGVLSAAGFWYWVLRRFAAPARAMGIVVLSGLLFFTYTASVQLRTEGLFCLFFSPAILMALQIAEGRRAWWRVAVLLVLCMLMVLTRWAGLVAWCAVAAALLSGGTITTRHWVVLALSFAVNAGTFVVIRAVLARLPAPPPAWVVERGKKGPKIPDEGGEGEAKLHPILTRKGMLETAKSMGNSGKWMASVLWMPLYLGVTNPAIGQATNLLGWLLIILCGLVAWRGARERKWLWLGAMLYCAGMIFRVRVPNPRYLMPVAPLVILAIWLGLEQLMKASRSERSRNTWSVLAKAFLFSVAAVNLALWCTDVYVNRSSHFYKTYRAGEAENLVSSAQYMRAHGVKDGQIAVNQFYVNLDRERTNGRALRATVMLTDRGVRGGPAGCLAEPNEALMKWAAKLDVKYYLYRPPVSPWRALHFKVRWLQELLTKQKNIPDNPSWVLYELRKDGAHKVDLPEMEEMSRVPGIGSD